MTGSDNGLSPWTGNTAPTPAQVAEVDARVSATVAWVDETFEAAERTNAEGVVLAMLADMFPTPPTASRR